MLVGACRGPAPAHGLDTRTITDMAGRQVAIPRRVTDVATLGAVPVINGFLFAFGAGAHIVNGLPTFARTPRFRYQTVFAPELAGRPPMQNGGREPDLERLTTARPDVAFTMDRDTADVLERGTTIPAVVLTWRQPDDVKSVMQLLGGIFEQPGVAQEYLTYFDATVARVQRMASAVPDDKKPRVLYCTWRRLTQEQLISEWWISTAGGRSVTDSHRSTESFTFTLEQAFAWDPDIIIVSSPEDLRELQQDARFSALKAVQHHAVVIAPTGAHQWANRTIEQPLTLLWAARLFNPSAASDIDMTSEMRRFYQQFFHYALTEEQARDILDAAI